MQPLLLFQTLVLGIVEGATEFLPVSSTGHLILVEEWLGTTGPKWECFAVFIQLGAILAVCWACRDRLLGTAGGIVRGDAAAWRFGLNIGLAFLPAAGIGYLCHGAIKALLFNSWTVACALAAGALVIFLVEGRRCGAPPPAAENGLQRVTPAVALKIGLAQVLAMVPGTSRSAATIIGGMIVGLDRRTATEFSFYLAIPTLGAAALYDLYKSRDLLGAGDVPVFAVGFVTAFVVALIAVRWLLRYVSAHDFRGFAWYRLGLAALVLGFGLLRGRLF